MLLFRTSRCAAVWLPRKPANAPPSISSPKALTFQPMHTPLKRDFLCVPKQLEGYTKRRSFDSGYVVSSRESLEARGNCRAAVYANATFDRHPCPSPQDLR